MNALTDHQRFSHAIGLLTVTYEREATEMLLSAYWIALDDLDIDQVEKAVHDAIRSAKSRFMPTPAELREFAGVSGSARSLAAWGDVKRCEPIGAYKSVDFRDPLINAAIRLLGGWPAMFERTATAEGEKWYRNEFTKTYETLVASGVNGDVCRPLTGITEITVIKGEVVPVPPIAIGCDAARRKLSMESVRGAITAPADEARSNIPRVEFKQS